MKSLQIFQEIGDRAGEAATWHQLASIDLDQGNHKDAKEKFMKSLQITQEIGDRALEASTWHQLASIDLDQDNHKDAKEKFMKSLQIKQEIGDRAGEAATWHQLGFLAIGQRRKAEGIRLVALCYLIDKSIGHGDQERDLGTLSSIASELDYSRELFSVMLRDVNESYRRDGGKALIESAFPH